VRPATTAARLLPDLPPEEVGDLEGERVLQIEELFAGALEAGALELRAIGRVHDVDRDADAVPGDRDGAVHEGPHGQRPADAVGRRARLLAIELRTVARHHGEGVDGAQLLDERFGEARRQELGVVSAAL
jgi:hypothetical protein